MIQNIVCDMGMVLLDHDPLLPCLRHVGDRAVAQRLCDELFWHPEWKQLIDGGVMTEKEYLPLVQARLETPELKALAAEILKDWYLDALFPKSGMEKLIGGLLDRGYRLYILSNAGYSFHDFSYKIKHLERFSGILVSAEEKLLKPDPAIYLRLCEKFHLKPEECLFIDDLQANIEGARSVGMTGYCFEDGNVARLSAYLDALER